MARFILKDEVRNQIKADKGLNMVLVTIGDAAATALQSGKQYTFDDANKQFADILPSATTHYKRGNKKGKPRKQKEIDSENANKAATLFRIVKQRYNSSDLKQLIDQLDAAMGGSGQRQATVELNLGQVEVATLAPPVEKQGK